MSEKPHHLIVVPGLGGQNNKFNAMVKLWEKFGFITHIYDFGWKNKEIKFNSQLDKLLHDIDDLLSQGAKISLIGTSAGGSAVLNAFYKRRKQIHRVVNICGRLRRGYNVYPTLEYAAQDSPSFCQSVTLFEDREPSLTEQERKRVLTIRAFVDEIVPSSTTTIKSATNNRVISVEHMLSIAAAMTIYVQPTIDFLKQE